MNFAQTLLLNLVWVIFAAVLAAANFGGFEIVLLVNLAGLLLGLGLGLAVASSAPGTIDPHSLQHTLQQSMGGTKTLPGTVGFYIVALITAVSTASLIATVISMVIGVASLFRDQKQIDAGE